jgi:hypothetical protein
VSDRGGRYGELSLAYRRRAGDVWWRAWAVGRSRLEGDPSGGLGAGAFWRVGGPLRLEAHAFGITQNTDTGTALTAWIDATASARIGLGGELFLTPSLGGLRRFGPDEDPGGDALDPDVWSRFDADHPMAAIGMIRLDYEPYLDLRAFTRLRLVTNADLASFDRAQGLAGVHGIFGRLTWGLAGEVEQRFADAHRMDARTRFGARAGGSYSLWRGDEHRLSIEAHGVARPPGDESEVFVGLAWDWTFGRGLRDYAPPELGFAAQLGPYAEGTSP